MLSLGASSRPVTPTVLASIEPSGCSALPCCETLSLDVRERKTSTLTCFVGKFFFPSPTTLLTPVEERNFASGPFCDQSHQSSQLSIVRPSRMIRPRPSPWHIRQPPTTPPTSIVPLSSHLFCCSLRALFEQPRSIRMPLSQSAPLVDCLILSAFDSRYVC